MGVHGLTSYVLENSNLYLKPFKLANCWLVMDGNNVAYFLAREMTSHCVFGGDYDEYFTLVRNFMLALKKCNVSPIILFDGGCKKAKLKTRLNRRDGQVFKLRSYCQGFSDEKFFSLFILNVFISVVREMGFIYVQCDLEADGEVAAVANALNCPVLAYDSDYFIHAVLYISFNTLTLSPTLNIYTGEYYLKCSIYNVDDFVKTVGIDKSLLPILASLLGNDYIENTVFSKFFNHIKMPKGKGKSHSQKRLLGLMQWLKNENFNSAVKLILSHLKKKDTEKVSKLFNTAITDYRTNSVSWALLDELTNKFGSVQLLKNDFSIKMPPEIAKLFAQALVSGILSDMILHQLHFTPLQVENIYEQSTHFTSLYFIRKIYTMLFPYLKKKQPLQLYLIVEKKFTCIKLDRDPSDNINLEEVLREPLETRIRLLCDIIGVPLTDLKIFPYSQWVIFIMSFIYWAREFRNSISLAHVHAFVIMMIANQVVQTKVGYYRNTPDFMKRYGDKLKKLKDTKLTVEESSNLKDMLANVKLYECLLLQKDLIPLRRTTPAGSGKDYCLSTIHLFNCFQSCLYYIMIINGLLNFPVPHLNIQDFYSGTLLFNLYIRIKSESSVEKFGSDLFSKTPNLNQIYKWISENLVRVLGNIEMKSTTSRGIGRRRRRKRKKKMSPQVKVTEKLFSTDEEGEFIDENNKYTVLLNVSNLAIS